MNFIKQIERINKAHSLIISEKTGTPEAFAKKLSMGRSQLYNLLDTLKSFGAPIKYCKKRESFYYDESFKLELKYSLKIIAEDEEKEIFGGFSPATEFIGRNSFKFVPHKVLATIC